MHQSIQKDHVAVITGAASGIGFAAAKRFSALGLKVCLADNNEALLRRKAAEIAEISSAERVMSVVTDVTRLADLEVLRDQVFERFGQVNVLMNNAGIGMASSSWGHYKAWQKTLDVNLWGVINGVQAFTEKMLVQKQPAVIINTGSKQGITCPPGNTPYNVSKAAVKALTESLQHSLRSEAGSQVSAHLFVPGFVYTEMMSARIAQKPPFAWTPEQTIDYMLERLGKGDFYMICPDGEVTEDMDKKRILWGAGDIVHNRPALSRWHPDYEKAFKEYMEE